MRREMNWVKTHPFWTLLIAVLVVALFQYLLFMAGGHGHGGFDVGPITPGK